MYRLIKDWVVDGLKISKGISFKEMPKSGILSKIPAEYFEEYSPIKFAKKKRKVKESAPKIKTQSLDQLSRISTKKI
jgi:hypothetical protein